MNDDLSGALADLCRGATAFVGIGNSDRGDDGVGTALAGLLRGAGVPNVYNGGAFPERVLPQVRDGGYDTVVFLDAVDAGCEPGSVVILRADQLHARYPQVSTHRLSLGTLARLVSDNNPLCTVWLVGIQPKSVGPGSSGLSSAVQQSARGLAQKFTDIVTPTPYALQEHVC